MTTHKTEPFAEALRRQLIVGSRRLVDLRRRRRNAALACCILVVAAAAGVTIEGIQSRPAAAHVQVTTSGGFITLRLTGEKHDARDIDRAVRGAGLDAASRPVPVGPSLEGKIIRASSDRPLPTSFTLLGSDGAFTGFRIPSSWRGTLRIDFGRAAKPGEVYVQTSDAFGRGEPLECSQALGQPIAVVRAKLARQGYTTSIVDGRSGSPIEPGENDVLGDAEVLGFRQIRLHTIVPGDPLIREEAPRAC